MKFDLLISQLDDHNEGNILASKRFGIKEIILICRKDQKRELDNLKEYYKKNLSKIKFIESIIDEGEVDKLNNIIEENKDKNLLVNVTGGNRISSLILLKLAYDNNIPCIYVDIKKKILYKIKREIEVSQEEFEDLELKDLIESSGRDIVEDSCNLCDKPIIVEVTKCICNNIPIWHKYKQKLYDGSIFIHDLNNVDKITIVTTNLTKEEELLLMKCLDKLKELKGLNYIRNEESINITFLNNYLKSFIFKSGTWLEVASNLLISEIKEIDEVKNGVMFLWDKEQKIVRNEVDIVALKDSILICISCKDSNKYNENALNELNVYSEKLGGKNSCKILVATKEPEKLAVRERAKEMGIHIVIFDGDENKFKNTIREIIKE